MTMFRVWVDFFGWGFFWGGVVCLGFFCGKEGLLVSYSQVAVWPERVLYLKDPPVSAL